MKKNSFIVITILLLFNSVNAQVLWSENFESYILGNIGTDVTGTVPGQGNWYTQRFYTSDDISNENFRINHEAGRGKYLILESTTIEEDGVFKETSRYMQNNIGSIWSLKDTTNNILKIEFEYNYYFYTNSFNCDLFILLTTNDSTHFSSHTHGLHTGASLNGKMVEVFNGAGQANVLPNLIANPNTWHKMIIYVDIDNNESYVEFPFKNYAIKSLGYIIGNYPFDPLDLDRFDIFFRTEDNAYGNSFLKIDNIKISAVNTLPTLNMIDLDFSKFHIFPNPANDIVTIANSESTSIKQVEFYDLTGKLIRTQNFNNESEIQLNVENLASGVYMLHIETEAGVAVKKLVKK